MSEEIKKEKSAEETLADVVKSEVSKVAETKADKADLEGLAKSEDIPSVEGFVKEDALSETNKKYAELAEKLDTIKAEIANAPAINKGVDKEMSDVIKFEGDDFTLNGDNRLVAKANIDFSKHFNKAELGTGSSAVVEGSTVASQRLYYQMQQKNPFRMVSTIMPTSGGSVNLPEVTSVTAAVENTLRAAATSDGGGISTVAVIPQNWVSRNLFSDQHAEDLPGLDQMVAGFMAQAIARAEAADMVSQLDGNSGISEVNTGAAATLPTTIGPWADLVAELDSAYRPNAKFMMSRAAFASLRSLTQSTGGDLVINPMTGMQQLWSYDIVINDHLDDGDTAADNAVYFGDFAAGSIIISRKEMNISRHEDTFPGGLYYYGNMRSRGVAWDTNALVRFNTAA